MICVLLLGNSCQTIKTTLDTRNCPEPKSICAPHKFTGIPRDTSALVAQIQGWHYRVEEVAQLNTTGDEWAVSFDKTTPYLTFSDGNRNNVLQCKYLAFNKILPQRTLQISDNGSLGFLFFNKNQTFFSFEKDFAGNKENEFYDSLGNALVPMHESIGQANLYSAELNKNEIVNPTKISFKNAKISEWYSQPAITPDGKVLFFASDRQGSLGGVDIWMAYLNDGKVSEPINCGSPINTECDEITPYVSPDGKYLYFSSNGGETVGGFDIFRTEISGLLNSSRLASAEELASLSIFKNRENIRAPFNTEYSEMSPSCNGDCDSIFYYSSNQNQVKSVIHDKGGFDIFVRYKIYVKKEKIKKQIEEPILTIENKEKTEISGPKTDWFYKLEGTVYEKKTNKPLDNAEVIAEETTGNNKNKVSTDSKGKYSIPMIKNEEYLVTATNKDLFPQNAKIFVAQEDTLKVVKRDFYLPEKYTLRVNFPTDIFDAPYRFVLDSNGNETDVLWQEDLSSLAENIISSKESILKIVLVGHTDDVASVEYNLKLGERRVNFVIEELVKRGVPRELLEGRSAGEMELLPKWAEETIDMNRKRCRRVVLEKVLK
jgi:outer membrane protein OmpA-like peptidoglycan-associated protein